MKPQPFYTVLVLALFCRLVSIFFCYDFSKPVLHIYLASKTKNAAKMRPKLVLCCISGFLGNDKFTSFQIQTIKEENSDLKAKLQKGRDEAQKIVKESTIEDKRRTSL